VDSVLTSSNETNSAPDPFSLDALSAEFNGNEFEGDAFEGNELERNEFERNEFEGDEFEGDEFDYEPDLDLDDMGLELAIADLVNDLQTAPAAASVDNSLINWLATDATDSATDSSEASTADSSVISEAVSDLLSTQEQTIAQDVLRYLLASDAGSLGLEDSNSEDSGSLSDLDNSDLDNSDLDNIKLTLTPPELSSAAIAPSASSESASESLSELPSPKVPLDPASVAIAASASPDSPLLDADLDADLSDIDLLDVDLDQLELTEDLLELGLLERLRSPLNLAGQPARSLAPPSEVAKSGNTQPWYLGLDIGTTGISAVLLNRTTCELHPVYWLEIKFPISAPDGLHAPIGSPEKTFRLPAVGYLPVSPKTSSVQESAAAGSSEAENLGAPVSIRSAQIIAGLAPIRLAPLAADTAFHLRQATYPNRLLLRDFKPYLRTGIPHYSPQRSRWEPTIQWTDGYAVPLSVFHQALRALLATLNSPLPTDPASNTSVLTCGAVGLDDATFQLAMQQLSGIIVSYPANWSDTYSFNLRETILASRLVARSEQIFFVEETIATLLSGLRSTSGQPIVLPYSLSQRPDLHNNDWQGGTLVLNAGATLTELALVNLPSQLQNLNHRDFIHRTVNYGGNALDQDIICQLIYPAWMRQLHQPESASVDTAAATYTFKSGVEAQAGAFTDGWNWQATDAEPDPWLSLGWDTLTLPAVGEPDLPKRYRLQQRLQSSPLGLSLIEAARQLKLSLQHQDHATMTLGAQTLVITRQDLGSRVLLLYVQRLNRELNALLNQASIPVLAVNQVICSGGTASLAAIARWLRQKFPNATITQDTYTTTPQDTGLLACSRVAYGLATLPLHPQVLDLPRQHYSDYFLLMEILRAFPDQPVTVNQLMQVLERRGIDTQSCQHHILALLEGRLPPGLLPTEKDHDLFTADSIQNPEYAALQSASLFFKQDAQTYLPNHQQWQQLRRYLDTLLSTTYQKLTEPLMASLVPNDG